MILFDLSSLETPEDKKRFEDLYKQTQKVAQFAALRFCRYNKAVAEDAVQSATVIMIKNWERYRQYPHDHQKALFITITKHKAIDIMGKEKHESLLNEDDGGKEPDFSFLVATKEENENLILYVNKLPEKYKTPLELRYYQNMSNREIAKVLGLTPHAVVMRLSRALDELRKIMQEGEDSQ